MANRILVDTGFWYAVFNQKDCHKLEAELLLNKYFDKPEYEIVVPFPTIKIRMCDQIRKCEMDNE